MRDDLSIPAPNFEQTLKGVKVYDLPSVHDSGLVDSPISAFEHGGNWYAAPKINGKVPADPSQWSLVVNEFNYNPNSRFYHAPQMAAMQTGHAELIENIGDGLSAKQKAGSLIENSAGALAPGDMAKIILSKEREGAGLRPGTNEPLHAFIAEHGVAPFKPTLEEIEKANAVTSAADFESYKANITGQRLARDAVSGNAFMARPHGGVHGAAFSDPRERVFYAAHPEYSEQVHRLKVGFNELLGPDGVRSHQAAMHESVIPLEDALKEIGPKADIAHAPEGIQAFLKGDPAGLQRYASKNLATEFEGRNSAKASSSIANTTDYLMGQELAGKDMTTQAWHRIVRPEDYVAQQSEKVAAHGSNAIESAGHRLFDSNRADYFLVREHPDYTANIGKFNYEGPREQLLFFKGNPQGAKPSAIETVDLHNDTELAMELRKRGIGEDTKLLKIGQDEYAELWNQRNLKEHIPSDFKLRQQTARDTIQRKPLKFIKFGTDHPLAEPIRVDAAGKLTGDVAGLSSRGLYKLGDDQFVHVMPEIGKNDKFIFNLYQNPPEGGIAHLRRESTLMDGEFEHKLAAMIKEKGSLTQASEQEAFDLARHLHQVGKGAGNESIYARLDLDHLLHSEKPKLPENTVARLQQAAEGTLKSTYTDIFVKKSPAEASAKPAASVSEPNAAADAGVSKPSAGVGVESPKPEVNASAAAEAAQSEGRFARFMKNEKWAGKKGLAVGGATVVLVGVVYGVNKLRGKNTTSEETSSWVDRTSQSPSGQRAK